jgi:hypothetical protein
MMADPNFILPIPFYFSAAAASAAKAFAASRIKYFFTTKRLVPH